MRLPARWAPVLRYLGIYNNHFHPGSLLTLMSMVRRDWPTPEYASSVEATVSSFWLPRVSATCAITFSSGGLTLLDVIAMMSLRLQPETRAAPVGHPQ